MKPSPSLEHVTAYWDASPCNIRHSPAEVGTREYFDQVEERKYYVEPHIPGFAAFKRWQGKRVLEIGCGIGTDAVNFVRAGAIYTGIDLSSQTIAVAQRRFEVFGLEGDLIRGNAENLDEILSDYSKFDLIYSFGVIHHTPDPLAVLRSARNLSHENTELRLMLYARNSWKAALIRAGLDQPEAQNGCPIALMFTPEEAANLLREADFDVLDIRQDHIFPYRVSDHRQFRYVREAWFEAMGLSMFKALEAYLGWHLLITARPR